MSKPIPDAARRLIEEAIGDDIDRCDIAVSRKDPAGSLRCAAWQFRQIADALDEAADLIDREAT